MRGWSFTLTSFVFIAAIAAADGARAAEALNLVQVRGAWLERFTRYTDWPSVPTGENPQFNLCVLNDHVFARLLREMYREQTIKSRPTLIHEMDLNNRFETCELIYIGNVEADDLPALLKRLNQHPALLVAAHNGFAEAGVHINLYEEQGLLRFEINLTAAKAVGINFSSRLLQVARVVQGSTP